MTPRIDWLTMVSDSEFKVVEKSSGEIFDVDNISAEKFRHLINSDVKFWDFGQFDYWQTLPRCKFTLISELGVKVSLLYSGHLMLTMSGWSCNQIGYDGLVQFMFRMRRGFHVTRIDVAVDMQLNEITALEIWADAGKVSASGRNRQTQLIVSANGLATAYFGSRTSDTFVRVYDKQFREGTRVLRFEVEVKGNLARNLLETATDDQAIRERFSYLCVRGEALVNSPILSGEIEKCELESPVSYPADSPSDLETKLKWFDSQVIPAFTKIAICNIDAATEIIRRMQNIAF